MKSEQKLWFEKWYAYMYYDAAPQTLMCNQKEIYYHRLQLNMNDAAQNIVYLKKTLTICTEVFNVCQYYLTGSNLIGQSHLRCSPCKNRPLEFLKITDFLHTFCVEEVIHKMNKKR